VPQIAFKRRMRPGQQCGQLLVSNHLPVGVQHNPGNRLHQLFRGADGERRIAGRYRSLQAYAALLDRLPSDVI
jgi:hypothetical protein